jgi:hypothetical protein
MPHFSASLERMGFLSRPGLTVVNIPDLALAGCVFIACRPIYRIIRECLLKGGLNALAGYRARQSNVPVYVAGRFVKVLPRSPHLHL